MKRLFALVASTIAAFAIAIPAASAAPAASANACSGGTYTLVSGNFTYSFNRTTSPYTLTFRNSGAETYYCKHGSAGSFQFEQNGTSRCLIASGSNIDEGSCSATSAHWNTVAEGGGVYEMKNDSNGRCIYNSSTASFGTCSSSNGNDLFFL